VKVFVLLVGCQGSGKTRYCEQNLKGYVRLSQDEMGHGFKDELFKALNQQKEAIVLDRINHRRCQRGDFIKLARNYGYHTRIVWINVDKDTCIRRIKERPEHPTLPPEKAEDAVYMFLKEFEVPSRREADELEIVGNKPCYVPVTDWTKAIGDRRYVVVGDLHGCLDELLKLLGNIKFDPAEDFLVGCGDIVDRGPKIKETIEYCRSLPRFLSVCGNHDDKCLRWAEGRNVKIANGLQKTIDAYEGKMPPDVIGWLRSFPLIGKVPHGYVVHGGFDPLSSPEEQQKSDCIFMRFYGGRTYFDSVNGTIWWRLWPSDAPTVFFGHIPEDVIPPDRPPNIVPLDGGDVFGGELRAWDSRDGQIHCVTALDKYSVSEYRQAVTSGLPSVSKREEYVVAGLLRKDTSDDKRLSVYTYTDQCTFDAAWDEVTRNSRGHIFDNVTGECVAWTFPKFFNLGENNETRFEKFDWTQPHEIFEKMDGWMGTLYRHGGYKVASRGSFHSDGAVWATAFIADKDLSFLPDEVTLVFEMITPEQRIILNYGDQKTLFVLAAFNRTNGVEYPRVQVEEWASRAGLPVVRKYDGMNIEDCLKIQKDGKAREGFVIRFADGRRVKVKTEWYMALAKLMARMSPIAMWEAMSGGKVRQEFLVVVPEEILPLAENYRQTLEAQYAAVREWLGAKCRPLVEKHKGDRKAIALNRESLQGTMAYNSVFSFVEPVNETKVEKAVMGAIYPRANEFVSLSTVTR
jgi:RNA ligase